MKEKIGYLIVILAIVTIVILILFINKDNKNELETNIQYVEIAIEDTESEDLAYTEPVKIFDEKILSNLEEQVSYGRKYEPKSTAWPDISPKITFYLKNGESYGAFATTFISNEDEDIGNYITVFKLNSKGEEDVEYEKKTYKIDVNLEDYITQLYNQFK